MRQGSSARCIALAVGDILSIVDADVVASGHDLAVVNLNEDVQGFPRSDERHLLEVRLYGIVQRRIARNGVGTHEHHDRPLPIVVLDARGRGAPTQPSAVIFSSSLHLLPGSDDDRHW